MMNTVAELIVSKSEGYNDKMVEALEKAGFTVGLSLETNADKYYDIAIESDY